MRKFFHENSNFATFVKFFSHEDFPLYGTSAACQNFGVCVYIWCEIIPMIAVVSYVASHIMAKDQLKLSTFIVRI